MIIINIHTYPLYQFQQSLETQTKSTDFDMHDISVSNINIPVSNVNISVRNIEVL
jgi:hypothetical protein